jgi:structural maintenance of chromosome 3 (chondroitin sulfate proteoglycan 6)
MKRSNSENGAAASTQRSARRTQDDDGDVEMAEASDEEEEEEEESGGANPEAGKVQQYTGVAIQVRFPGAGEAHFIQQLSGGQKTLVALTLIFAIQRCDPAPFYLFDEIDSALDAAYRTSVARMIKKQSEQNGIQFITTTFKTELVEYGDRFYGIQYRNKVSSIGRITKQRALEILAEEEQLQRQQRSAVAQAETM